MTARSDGNHRNPPGESCGGFLSRINAIPLNWQNPRICWQPCERNLNGEFTKEANEQGYANLKKMAAKKGMNVETLIYGTDNPNQVRLWSFAFLDRIFASVFTPNKLGQLRFRPKVLCTSTNRP